MATPEYSQRPETPTLRPTSPLSPPPSPGFSPSPPQTPTGYAAPPTTPESSPSTLVLTPLSSSPPTRPISPDLMLRAFSEQPEFSEKLYERPEPGLNAAPAVPPPRPSCETIRYAMCWSNTVVAAMMFKLAAFWEHGSIWQVWIMPVAMFAYVATKCVDRALPPCSNEKAKSELKTSMDVLEFAFLAYVAAFVTRRSGYRKVEVTLCVPAGGAGCTGEAGQGVMPNRKA